MKNNNLKLFTIAIFVLLIIALGVFQTNTVTVVRADATADEYKKNCLMCHGATADKKFDPNKTDEELIEVILKGKKPMPGYEAKGWTAEQAKTMVTYMKGLRAPQQ